MWGHYFGPHEKNSLWFILNDVFWKGENAESFLWMVGLGVGVELGDCTVGTVLKKIISLYLWNVPKTWKSNVCLCVTNIQKLISHPNEKPWIVLSGASVFLQCGQADERSASLSSAPLSLCTPTPPGVTVSLRSSPAQHPQHFKRLSTAA